MDVHFPIKGLKLGGKTESDWWITLFKDIRGAGIYCDSDSVQAECLKFVSCS